ncbi:hypothetical protein lerEdw1_016042 [Lerista edwardsae]|nr:hypothetical protein lerEdw1_016042 [Lerista edwardsae]
MKRNKKPSVPVSSVVPAVRRRGSSAKESESSCDLPSLASSTSESSSPGDLFQLSPAGSKTWPGRVEKLPWTPDAAPALQLEPCEPQEPPPPQPPPCPPSPPCPPPAPPPVSWDCLDNDHGARGFDFQSCEMLNIFRSIPTQMDYKGQKLAEQIFQGIILVSAVIGFIYGYITEQFGWTVYIVMAGFALSCLLTLPPWPIYRRNPLKWLPVQELATDDKKPADKKVKRHPKN